MKFIYYFKEKIPREIKYIFLLFFSTRIILTLIGVLSRIILEPFHGKEYVWVYSKYLWLDIWGVWDTGWYLDIAKNWYSTRLNELGQANYGFFPLYPLLMRLIGLTIGDYYIAGLIISNIFLIIACIFLYKLVCLDSGGNTARRSIKYLFLFPTAFIFSGVFSESLFLALLIMCFYYAKKGNWRRVGIIGFFLSLTRPIGVFVILPLLYEYLKGINFRLKETRIDILFLLLILSGPPILSIYHYYLTGDFLAYVHIKKTGWKHVLSNPFIIIYYALLGNNVYFVFVATLFIAIVLILSSFYRRIGFSYWTLAMILLFTPLILGGNIASLLRYTLIVFPLYILLAKLSRNQYLDKILTIILPLLQGFLMVFWSNGFWFIR